MLAYQSHPYKKDNQSNDNQEQFKPCTSPLHSTNVNPHYKYNKNYD